MKIFSKHMRGFTLVEMIVSMAIFAVVAVVAAAALLRILDANKKAQNIQSAITNLNFALESMSRELRVGTKFQCGLGTSISPMNDGSYSGWTEPAKCTVTNDPGGAYIVFKSSESAAVGSVACDTPYRYNLAYAYRFRSLGGGIYTLEKAQQSQPTSCNSPIPINDAVAPFPSDFAPVVSTKNVNITGYSLSVAYDKNNQQKYPLASIRIGGYTGSGDKNKTYFTVQTAASPRLP